MVTTLPLKQPTSFKMHGQQGDAHHDSAVKSSAWCDFYNSYINI